MEYLVASIIILFFCIIFLARIAIDKLNEAGLTVKSFTSFVSANRKIDDVFKLAKKYDSLNVNKKMEFIKEADEIFLSFKEVPDMLWEEEYNKYSKILSTYNKARVDNWQGNNLTQKAIEAKKRKIKMDNNNIINGEINLSIKTDINKINSFIKFE